ncbi:MAG: NERD domain-containing protein [Lentisphaeraceae bacterium]|nr:NERD domain-containing protein [Lentisphaeraceae bacterium]
MIIKSIDPKTANHKMTQAGLEAEKQMAFYLERFFGEDKSIVVINDLRFEYKGAIAQIDHLVIHEFGFLVIESKSVCFKVSINDHGEWIRHYRGETGMKSPINQALLQIDLLKKTLNHYADVIDLKNNFGKKISTDKYKFDVLIAISDQGIIERPNNIILNEIHKADQIPGEILKLIETYKKEHNKLLNVAGLYYFQESTIMRIAQFLASIHLANQSKISQEGNKLEEPYLLKEYQGVCRSCNSLNISVFNSYGYRVKCADCNISEKFQVICPKCLNGNLKLKNNRGAFTISCTCNFSAGYLIANGEIEGPLKQIKGCPKCGSELVERVAKKGKNEGNKFLGCSGFPKCRYLET